MTYFVNIYWYLVLISYYRLFRFDIFKICLIRRSRKHITIPLLNVSGESNIRVVNPETKIKGYDWVGWRNDSSDDGRVEILFEFENIRNFSSVTINSNNFNPKNIRIFKQALVFFSVGGKFFLNNPVKYEFLRVSSLNTHSCKWPLYC